MPHVLWSSAVASPALPVPATGFATLHKGTAEAMFGAAAQVDVSRREEKGNEGEDSGDAGADVLPVSGFKVRLRLVVVGLLRPRSPRHGHSPH